MSLPYMPLYVDDYEADTAHLTLVEDGIYSRLLRLCWRTPRCRMPNDIEWISRKVRVSSDEEMASLKSILNEFFTVRKGSIFSKRLMSEYDRATTTSQKRKEAGKSGGFAKALKNKRNGPSSATVLPEQNPSNHNHNHNHEKTKVFSKGAGAQKKSPRQKMIEAIING